MRVEVDKSISYQTFDGIGASGAWWAQIVGGWNNTDENGEEVRNVISRLLYSKENGEREAVREYKSILADLKAKKKENDFRIRVANHKHTVYCRAVKPYIDAKRIIAQAECYSNIDEIINI